jgi:hypothetical protein
MDKEMDKLKLTREIKNYVKFWSKTLPDEVDLILKVSL